MAEELTFDSDEEEETIDPVTLVFDLYSACKAGEEPTVNELLDLEVPVFAGEQSWSCLHWVPRGAGKMLSPSARVEGPFVHRPRRASRHASPLRRRATAWCRAWSGSSRRAPRHPIWRRASGPTRRPRRRPGT